MPRKIRAARGRPAPEPKPFRAAGGFARFALPVEGEKDGEGKPKLGTFTGRAYTGKPMRPLGWYYRVVIDLAGVRVKDKRPALRQHDHEQIVGHTVKWTVTEGKGGGIDVDGVFSGQDEHVVKVTDPARKGFEWQLSIGADPVSTEFLEDGEELEVNGETVTGPIVISRVTDVGEVSFVPLGADDDTSVSVNASKGTTPMFRAALKALELAEYTDEQIDKMTEDEARAALKKCMKNDDKPKSESADGEDDDEEDEGEDDPPAKTGKKSKLTAGKKKPTPKQTLDALVKASIGDIQTAAAAEIRRQESIKAHVDKFQVKYITVEGTKVLLAAHAIDKGWSADQVELECLRAARPGPETGGPQLWIPSQPEMSEQVLECAVLQAMRHSYRLEDPDFYYDEVGPEKIKFRRVPSHIQADTQREINTRYTEQVRDHAHKAFKGRITLQQLLDLSMQAMGATGRRRAWKTQDDVIEAMKYWDALDRNRMIRAEGASDISVSNILANVLNKFALQGYLFVESAWRMFCAVRPVNDFKPTKSINLLGDVIYKMFGASGVLESFSLQDQAFPNQAFPFGRIGTIPWKTIVDDDLSMLQTVPQKLGQGAGLALNDMIWSLITCLVNGSVIAGGTAGNPYGAIQTGATITADDGSAFFRTSTNLPSGPLGLTPTGYYNKNKLTGVGSALSATSLGTAKALFDNQIDPNGNPLGYDGVKPVLLIGPSNWQTARNLLQADLIVSGNTNAQGLPNKNAWANYADLAFSRYVENTNYLGNIDATGQWFLFFNPIALAAIEVCFLNGVDTPAVLTAGPDYQFDRPGISVRGTMPFGVTQQNFRAVVYNAGQ